MKHTLFTRLPTRKLLYGLLIVILSMAQGAAGESDDLYEFDKVQISDESSANIHQSVKTLATSLADPAEVKIQADAILMQIHQGEEVGEYDFLWIPYALLKVAYAGSGSGLSEPDDLKVALNTLTFLDEYGVGDWQFTELGQFKMEVNRIAANSAAWALRESKPKQALEIIQSALSFARDEDLFMLDTYVRVLLNLGQAEQAYTIVKQTLEENPDFGDFQEFKHNHTYLSWAKNN